MVDSLAKATLRKRQGWLGHSNALARRGIIQP